MTQFLVDVLGGFADLARKVGFINCLLALLSVLVLGVFLKAADRLLNVWSKMSKEWNRLSRRGKRIVVAGAAIVFVPRILSSVPVVTLTLVGGLVVWAAWWSGAAVLACRYSMKSASPAVVWRYHLESAHRQRQLTKGVGIATGAENGRVRRPVIDANGSTQIVEPPDGISPAKLVEQITNGTLHPSIARQLGWENTQGMSARDLGNGLVEWRIDNQPAPPEHDYLSEAQQAVPTEWMNR